MNLQAYRLPQASSYVHTEILKNNFHRTKLRFHFGRWLCKVKSVFTNANFH